MEIASNLPGVIPVRDSKMQNGPVLLVGAAEFTTFLEYVKTK